MTTESLYSQRKREAGNDGPDVYTYNSIPREFRVQFVHLLSDTLGGSDDYRLNKRVRAVYKALHGTLCREYGTFRLCPGNPKAVNCCDDLFNFILTVGNAEQLIDVVEASSKQIRNAYEDDHDTRSVAHDAIKEINQRFRENAIGYQLVEDKIVRVDARMTHNSIVKPALSLLEDDTYKTAQEEFFAAYEHYNKGEYCEVYPCALKAINNTISAICTRRKGENMEQCCQDLFENCFEKGLIPPFWKDQLEHIRDTIKLGVRIDCETLTGPGDNAKDIPEHVVSYILNMTASAIVFLVESENELEKSGKVTIPTMK